MSRLAELLQIHHGESLDQLCESLTRGLLPAGQQSTDDAALLVARVHATAPDAIASWSLPEEPLAARAARQYVRDQLAAWHLEELAMNTESLASELVANVIRHAHGPMRLRLLRSRTLVCEVFDGSATIPRIRRASWSDEGGRGLQLVTALCDRWGTRYMTTGKCIWTEQSLPLPAVRRACSAAGGERRARPARRQGHRSRASARPGDSASACPVCSVTQSGAGHRGRPLADGCDRHGRGDCRASAGLVRRAPGREVAAMTRSALRALYGMSVSSR
jgi:Histidine kinase-like ATPase domain